MNRNPKVDTARIDLRLKPAEKTKIQRLAKRCGLSTTEYLVQRALGYAPKEQTPDALYDFYGRLCGVCNLIEKADKAEIEAALLELANDFHNMALLPEKEDISGSLQSHATLWGEEHPRSGEPFPACGESDERSVM